MPARGRIVRRQYGLPDERSRKGEGQHDKQRTANEQQQNVFELALARDGGWIGAQKHQRAEGKLFLGVAPNEMKKQGGGDGHAAEQK